MLGFRKMDDGRWTRDATHATLAGSRNLMKHHKKHLWKQHKKPLSKQHKKPLSKQHKKHHMSELKKPENMVRVVTLPRRAKEHEKRKESVGEVIQIAMVEEDEGYCKRFGERSRGGKRISLGFGQGKRHSRFQICLDITVEELDDKSYIGST
ncbi:hypothetical protein DM860_006595 [Cuscuta australis]|uniref:Uncharacterized protein n=1 Tax=Cuscuta australis TaxID=267555 RepID=A0A328D485_9ASTE|nr:hypothetical protein DM860_006595 [Cuscuta australis]